jgi:hypothetical protein
MTKRPKKNFNVVLSNSDIIRAYNKVSNQIEHTDAPTEAELCLVREHLPVTPPEIISLHWLRNRIVALRKSNKLNKDRDHAKVNL